MMMPLSRAATLAALLAAPGAAVATPGEVVVYATVDDIFARPIAERFTASTGITVKLVPDTEETKSTGLLDRAIAEKNGPQADVFWNGDPIRAEILKLCGMSAQWEPGCLFLDEPFSGLDLVTKAALLEDISRIVDARKVTLVLVTHDPLETTTLCRSAVLIDRKRIEQSGRLEV
jgi:ABC-type lipopolysaccharide export system ATPase subunit